MSIEDLFAAHHEKVFQAAYRITGNAADAEDALQAVFLQMLKHPDPSAITNPAAYLCRAAVNSSLDQLRKPNRSSGTDRELDEQVVPGLADVSAQTDELRQHLRNALAELHPRTAEIFSLRYLEEFSNGEIAALLDTSPGSIAVTLHRARDQLQALLREFEGEKND